jgi:hypothetical protein
MSRRARGLDQAIALQPDSIVLGTVDANEQAAVIGLLPRQASWRRGRPCSSNPASRSTAGRRGLASGYPKAYKSLRSVP